MNLLHEDMIEKIKDQLLEKAGTRYNKDELTKKILRNIRRFYRHKFISGHSKNEMSNKRKGLPLLLKHLLQNYNIDVHLKPLELNHPSEYQILLWSFCTKTVQKQARTQNPPLVFLTGYKKYLKAFLTTEVGFYLYFHPFVQIWLKFVAQAPLSDKKSFKAYIKSIQQETRSYFEDRWDSTHSD